MYLKWAAALLALATSTLGASSTDKAYNELITLSAKAPNGVIQLDSRTYDLLTSPARNWSAAVHFTALDPRRRCEPCKEFAPSFDKVGKSWSGLSPKSTRDAHFFGTLDFDNGQTVFQALNMMSAPVVHVYPATQGPHRVADQKQPFIKYDFSQGFEAAPLAEALSSHTPVTIPYREPIDYAKYATFAAALIPLGIAVRVLGPAFINRWTWAFTCIVTSLVMTSGFMFVRIRGMPQQAPDGQWIAQGYQNQYGAETRVVAGIYGILGASFLMLTLVTPLQKSKSRQRIQVYLWSAVIFVVFSILISLFKVKNRGYPFKLLL